MHSNKRHFLYVRRTSNYLYFIITKKNILSIKGQADDELFNDLFTFEISFNEENNKKSKAADVTWKRVETNGKKPLPRSSHSCNSYKDEYLIIIGGEGISEHSK